MPSPAFAAFVAPARARPALWRLALGIVLIVLVYAASFAAAISLVTVVHGPEPAYDLASRLLEPGSPGPALFLLATFAGMAAGPLVAVRLLHGRAAGTLFGRAPRVLRDFVAAMVTVGSFYAVALAVWSVPYDAQAGLPAGTWLAILPLTLAGLLLQTGAEELVFRGYLTQQLAARFRSRWVWFVLPSLMFGLVHYAPVEVGPDAWMLVAGAALFGLFAADLTAVTGSIGAAWGFHFANNVAALAILATDGTITGLALYVTPYAADGDGVPALALAADYAMLAGAWALCRLVLRR